MMLSREAPPVCAVCSMATLCAKVWPGCMQLEGQIASSWNLRLQMIWQYLSCLTCLAAVQEQLCVLQPTQAGVCSQ